MAAPTSEQLAQLVETHLKQTESQSAAWIARCRVLEEAYKPSVVLVTGAWDLWPWAAPLGQAHVSIPVVWFTVNVMSSLLGIRPPRFIVRPKKKSVDAVNSPEDLAAQAENDLIDKEWDGQEMDVAHLDHSKTLSLYGDAVFKHGYEGKELWTENVDLPYTVWVNYRADNFNEPLTITHCYLVTEEAAKEMGWSGNFGPQKTLMFNPKIYGLGDHANALGLPAKKHSIGAENYFVGVPVVEFYCKWDGHRAVSRAKGTHYYGVFIGGELTDGPKATGLDDLGFLFTQGEHIPGEKHGVGDAEPILDVQDEVSQRTTIWAEAIRRNIRDQWKSWGLRDTTPVELAGGAKLFELTDKNTDDIEPLKFPIDNAGVKEYLEEIWEDYRRITGLPPEVLGGGTVHAETSGYAIQVKYQAVINRLEPRRIRMSKTYRRWAKQTLKKIAKVEHVDAAMYGERQIDIDWDLITPRDFEETVRTVANARAAKLVSQHTGIEEIGKDPIEEQARMRIEETDPKLFPAQAMQAAEAAQMAQGGGQQQKPDIKIALTGQLPPEDVAAAAAELGVQAQPQGGAGTAAAQDQAGKDQAAAQPQLSEVDNQHVIPGGRASSATSAVSGPGIGPANVGGPIGGGPIGR